MRGLIREGRVRFAFLFVTVFAAVLVAAGSAAGPLVNGDFETGDLTGWTTFTTTDGIAGPPVVVPFDTTGTGASNAAEFQVGRTVPPFGLAPYAGGGIYQNVNAAGLFDVSADIAATPIVPNLRNSECGRFDLLVDGVVVATHIFGSCNVTVRSTLSATGLTLTPGSHEIRIQISRPFLSSPFEYVDNVNLTQILPTSKDQCMKGGWQSFLVFKNQGDCVSYDATGGKNEPAG